MQASSNIETIIGWLKHEGASDSFIYLVKSHSANIFDGEYKNGFVYLNFKSEVYADEFLTETKGERGRGTRCAPKKDDRATIIVSAGV